MSQQITVGARLSPLLSKSTGARRLNHRLTLARSKSQEQVGVYMDACPLVYRGAVFQRRQRRIGRSLLVGELSVVSAGFLLIVTQGSAAGTSMLRHRQNLLLPYDAMHLDDR